MKVSIIGCQYKDFHFEDLKWRRVELVNRCPISGEVADECHIAERDRATTRLD